MGNRITRKAKRNAADAAAQHAEPLPSSSPRFEIRKALGGKYVPWDTLTNHVPMGYTHGFPDIPTCQKAIEQSLALQF